MQEIEIVEKDIGDVLEIEEQVPVWKMVSVMGKDFALLAEYLQAKGVESKEVPYARYLDIDWDLEMKQGALANFIRMFTKKWHFQVGMPISSKIENKNNLVCRKIEHKKYVKTIHYGPYQKVGVTYKKMYAWAREQKLSFESESIEFYLNDPRNTKKESLETMVLIPVKNE